MVEGSLASLGMLGVGDGQGNGNEREENCLIAETKNSTSWWAKMNKC